MSLSTVRRRIAGLTAALSLSVGVLMSVGVVHATAAEPDCMNPSGASPVARAAIQAACGLKRNHVDYGLGSGHGANPGPTGGKIDCSGLTRYAYARAVGGDPFGNSSAQVQWQNVQGQRISNWSELQPGDLIFYEYDAHNGRNPDHVAIAFGGGWTIEALNTTVDITMRLNSKSGFKGAIRPTIAAGGQGASQGIRHDHISDWSGDGHADILGVNATGELWYYPNNGGAISSASRLQSGFNGFTHVMAADWSGDGHADALGVNAAGELWYYPNNGGAISSGSLIAHNFNQYTQVMAADWSGDGFADVLALGNDGRLWYYPHNGSGLGSRVLINSGFNGFTQIMAADWSGDGYADILGVNAAGTLLYYPHTGSTLGTPSALGSGFNMYTTVFASDWSGDGYADILGLTADGGLWYYPHTGSGLGSRNWLQGGFNGFRHIM